ncbi:MAG: TlpA family protein disulfide reductase [Marinifilum sp.]|jgi:peroxiredoxin|nr:TlpA family protein disulfide reductase [Marinifilum sp.]
MRKILTIIAIVACFISCNQTNKTEFTIKGKIIGEVKGPLQLLQDGKFIKLENKDNTFELKGSIENIQEAEIWYGFESQLFYYGPGTTELTLHVEQQKKNTVSGAVENQIFKNFLDQLTAIDEKNVEKRKSLIIDFVQKNRNSQVAIRFFEPKYTLKWENKEYKEAYAQLADHVKQSYVGKIIGETVRLKENSEVGRKFIDISLPNLKGDTISLSDVVKENKLTVLDFWSSTCGYCRRDAQVLLKHYPELKEKGLEVFACSLDRRKDKWMKAIDEDKTNWIHVMDKEQSTANDYYLVSIPVVLVINNKGEIIANDLSPEGLVEFLRKELEK